MNGRIRWVDDAWVSEHVPAGRTTFRYQLARSARVAENVFRIHRRRRGMTAALWRYLPKALGRLVRGSFSIFGGLALVVFSRSIGGRMFFSGCKALASSAGTVLGLLGVRLEPYRPQGRDQ
jgi:succinoglycan biosynthesis protein ExoM